MQWGQAGKTRKYTFTYDNLSRLKTAAYTGESPSNFAASYTYDKHGNMLTLQRYGLTGASTYGITDNLTMVYNGNQMKTVTDAVADIALNASMDFKDYTKGTGTEYTYNANGAMNKDLNRGISQIQYNSLNLPRIVDIKNKSVEGRNEYTYSASGQKLKAVQKWNPNYSTSPVIGSTINTAALTMSSTTDYVGNIIYENNALKRILVDGGYYEGGNYYFYITDHLGNNRIVANAAASVVQSTQYYPFGTSFADATGASAQPYKYNGKELDSRNGLNMYDYSARFKDDFRFTSVDPLAEKYYSWSPYAYVMNNPMKFIDPTGMDSENGLTNNLEPEKSSWERMMENKSRSDDYKVKNYISTAGSPTDIVTKDGTIIGHYPDGQNALYCADELNPIYATPYGGSLPVSIGGVSYMYNLNTRALSGPMGEVGLINVHPEFDLLFAGRGIANVIAKKALSSGLSNMETRLWYNKQLRNLNISVSYTEENAILIHGQRNGLKAQARSMMADRDAAALLDITDPLKPMDYYVTKYSVQGYSGEALWKKIIESASKPNTIINSKFGIK